VPAIDFSAFPDEVALKAAISAAGPADELNSGWIAPDRRDAAATAAHNAVMSAMSPLAISGTSVYADATAVRLWDCWEPASGKKWFGVRQVTGSCFPAGTPVRMADGSEKAIEDVSANDVVVSHTGASRKVVETMRRTFTGELVTLHVVGFAFPLTMTADHQVAVMRSRAAWRWQPDYIDWVRADEIEEGDRVLIGWGREQKTHTIDLLPILGDDAVDMDDLASSDDELFGPYARAEALRQTNFVRTGASTGMVRLKHTRYHNAINRYLVVTEAFARLVGIYLAEGGVDSGRVTFTFSAAEKDTLAAETVTLVRGVFGVESVLTHEPDKGRTTVRVSNANVAEVLKKLIPGNVYTKRVPSLFFTASDSVKCSVIAGWFAGDGYYRAASDGRDPRIQGVTSSPLLARDITTLALSVGYKAACSRRKPRKQSREAWDVYLSGEIARVAIAAAKGVEAGTCTRRGLADTARCQFGYARSVKRVERQPVESLQVFDFEVEEDHSFVAGGIVVHNCVGAGGGNMLFSLACADVIRRGDPERVVIPFWLLPYGISRMLFGINGRGSGSSGSTFAQAVSTYGMLPADVDGLPAYAEKDGWVWGQDAELEWSQGRKIPSKYLQEARPHLVQGVAKCVDADAVREALKNFYAVTCASNWGGMMNPPVVGSGANARLLNRRVTTWNHQMSVHAWEDNPEHGEIFYILNQWGDCHGHCPSGAPRGGFWIKRADMNIIASQGETFAFSNLLGFPAVDKPLDFSAF